MIAALLVSGTLLLSSAQGTSPGTYSDKWLCDLWAGAQCYQTSCQKDAKAQCEVASKRCRGRGRQTVPEETAKKTASCAKAMLQQACGAPAPDECKDVTPP